MFTVWGHCDTAAAYHKILDCIKEIEYLLFRMYNIYDCSRTMTSCVAGVA